MLINDIHQVQDFSQNPTITVTDMTNKNNFYSFPDPNSYFILSKAGKDYKLIVNNAVLLNVQRGYYWHPFNLSFNQNEVISLAVQLFDGSKQLDRKVAEALNYALGKSGKSSTTFPNRY
jgi:hypothetical protein